MAGSDGHHSVNTILMSFPPVTQHHQKEKVPSSKKLKKIAQEKSTQGLNHSVNTILMSFPPVTQHHEKEQGPELQKV